MFNPLLLRFSESAVHLLSFTNVAKTAA